jgi:hypothetical protein
LLLRAAALLALVGCSDDGTPVIDAPTTCPIGDRSLPIELDAMHTMGGAVTRLADGGEVELSRPIQGGKVIYVGVTALNVDGCNLQLNAALRDAASNQVIALEQRPVRLVTGPDGWGVPASPFDDLANVPACPNAAATVDIDQASWQLELRLEESGGRSATKILTVAPRCARFDERAECECECDSDYELGSGCPADPIDAGVD